MEQNTDISLNIIDSLDDLLILQFWKIIETGNYLLLYPDYNKKREYTADEQNHANTVWLELYDEYYEQCKDGKSHNELNKDNKEQKLHLRITCLISLLNMIGIIQEGRDLVDDDIYAKMMNEAIETIYKAEPNLKGKLNVFDSAANIAEGCKKLIKSLEGQYKRLMGERPKRIEKAVKKVHNVYERVAYMSEGHGFQVSVQNMCVNEWLGFEKALKQKIKASQKHGK